MSPAQSTLRSLGTRSVDVKAVILASVAFAVVRHVVYRYTRPAPCGPLVHPLCAAEAGLPAALRVLTGDIIAALQGEAGATWSRWVRAARSSKGGDPRAVALWRGGAGSSHLLLCHADDLDFVVVQHPAWFIKSELHKTIHPVTGRFGLATLIDETEHTTQHRVVAPAFAAAHVHGLAGTVVRRVFAEWMTQLCAVSDEAGAGGHVGDVVRAGSLFSLEEAISKTTLRVIAKAAFEVNDVTCVEELLRFLKWPPSPLLALGPDLYNRLPIERNRVARVARDRLREPVLEALRIAQRQVQDCDTGDSAPQQRRHSCDDEADADFVSDPKGTSTSSATSSSEAADFPRHTGAPLPQTTHRTLIQLLADSQVAGDLSLEQVLDQSITFVFAGHETTSATWCWTLYYLTVNPRAQDTLLSELREAGVRGGPTAPPLELVERLPYLTAVVREGLRLCPPISALMRTAVVDAVLPGSQTYVPAGTDLHIPLFVLQRDPTVYGPDADDFRPERWLEDPGLYERVKGRSFVPFGVGKRSCVGRDLARAELLMGVAMIVRTFELSWPEGETHPTRAVGPAVHPSHAFQTRLTRRAV